MTIDFTVLPSVWLGTSTGCVIVINLNINYEPRNISGNYFFDLFVKISISNFQLYQVEVYFVYVVVYYISHFLIIKEQWFLHQVRNGIRKVTIFFLKKLIFWYIDIETKPNRPTDGFTQPQDLNSSTGLPGSGVMSSAPPSATSISNNIQYAVFCSSKQARVWTIIFIEIWFFIKSIYRSWHYHHKFV